MRERLRDEARDGWMIKDHAIGKGWVNDKGSVDTWANDEG